jgi:uncharacterized protein involved in cysteine biosynthesis
VAGETLAAVFYATTSGYSDPGANGLEAKIEARLWELWKDVRLYLYAAAAALFVILLVPAIIGSVVTVLLMRAMDRRRNRKAAPELHLAE